MPTDVMPENIAQALLHGPLKQKSVGFDANMCYRQRIP